MNRFAIAAAASLALTPVAANAVVTSFATFSATSSSYNVAFDSGTDTFHDLGTAKAPITVNFTLLGDTSGASKTISAVFALSSLSSGMAESAGNGSVSQGSFVGNQPSSATPGFSFKSSSGFTYNGKSYAAGTNLLSAGFTNAVMQSTADGRSASFIDSTPGDAANVRTVDYTSAVFDFSKSTDRSFAFNLDAATPQVHIANGSLASFSAVAGGTFSSDGMPTAVPEAGTWLMMLVGFAGTGFAMRRKRRVATYA